MSRRPLSPAETAALLHGRWYVGLDGRHYCLVCDQYIYATTRGLYHEQCFAEPGGSEHGFPLSSDPPRVLHDHEEPSWLGGRFTRYLDLALGAHQATLEALDRRSSAWAWAYVSVEGQGKRPVDLAAEPRALAQGITAARIRQWLYQARRFVQDRRAEMEARAERPSLLDRRAEERAALDRLNRQSFAQLLLRAPMEEWPEEEEIPAATWPGQEDVA